MVPSASVPLPAMVSVLVGRVTDLSAPALATGATLVTGAALTVTMTSSVPTAPRLSVIFNRKVYVPATRPLTLRVEVPTLARVAAPPDTLVHSQYITVPVPVPAMLTVLVGRVMVWSAPALATGAPVLAGFTVSTTSS